MAYKYPIKDSDVTIQDNSDATKQLQFELSSITTGTTRILTVPNASTTIVGTDATQTLTNKTITSGIFNSLYDTNGNRIIRLSPAVSAVNYWEFVNSSAGNTPSLLASGSDTDISMWFATKGTAGNHFFANSSGQTQFRIGNTASAVNYLRAQGGTTGSAASLLAAGSDTDVHIDLVSKNAGLVKANGIQVADISSSQTLTNKTLTAPKISGGSGTATISAGTGTPEGVVTAEVGSLFMRTDGGVSTTLYVKESGIGNTGWVAK